MTLYMFLFLFLVGYIIQHILDDPKKWSYQQYKFPQSTLIAMGYVLMVFGGFGIFATMVHG